MAVVASVAGWSQSLVAVRDHEPDVVLLDMAMPDSVLAVRSLAAAAPAVKVVAVAVPDSERDVIACVEAGVAGYVTREASVDELVQTTLDAARGELHLPPRMAARLVAHVAELATERPGPEARLTTRELEIVDLIDDGLSNKQIAHRLCIEVPTVKNHVHNILEKLQVERRTEASARARASAAAAPGHAARRRTQRLNPGTGPFEPERHGPKRPSSRRSRSIPAATSNVLGRCVVRSLPDA